MTADEYKRKFRVLDQMLSAHSDLRDRYRRRSTGLTLLIMTASVLTTLLALAADSEQLEILSITAEESTWLAILGAAIFAIAIAELVVDWRAKAWAHGDAAQRLGEVKGKFRRAAVSGNEVDTAGADLDQEYDETTASIVEIPNRLFNRLKAKHRRKIEISRLLDERPGAPLLYLRWLVLRDGVQRGVQDDASEEVLEASPPGSQER